LTSFAVSDTVPHGEVGKPGDGDNRIMENTERTLVILLTMHRCGSSLTTNVLQRLGMSLGPFELLKAAPSNPYGHFESVPFWRLNQQIQNLAFGFLDDLPDSPETLARFLDTNGHWDEGTLIPDELFTEGRSLIRALVNSGQISGFKDPRTVLTWPFWKRVLESFPGLRVVPVTLLRSPHEVAMSLVVRRGGSYGYWTSLDLVAIHFQRQKAILESWEPHPPCLCFGSPEYLRTLEAVSQYCGLNWNAITASEVFDRSCVHHLPASVPHEAQDLFESLYEGAAPSGDPEKNRDQLESDARLLESLRLEQWQLATQQMLDAREQTQQANQRVVEARQQTGDVEARLAEVQSQLLDSHARGFDSHARVLDSHARVVEVQALLISEQQRMNELQAQLNQSQAALGQSQAALSQSQTALNQSQAEIIQSQAEIIQSRDREIHAWQQNVELKVRVQKMESHPLLGPALRTRRRMRRIFHMITANSANGHSAHRVDSPD
jgi:hypothetical protein